MLVAQDGLDTDGYNATNGRRDWWVQLLQSRDGRLVTQADGSVRKMSDSVTQLYLPGLADSTPFRGISTAGFTQSATRQSPGDVLDNTIFRRLPIDLGRQAIDTPSADSRNLWEVGNYTDHANGAVDPLMRHRLLSKIFNNTTTRSHVLIVFMTVQLFEADDTTNGPNNPLIGGPLTGAPTYRGFFIIDRSQPEEAYDLATGTFRNFRALVKYRLPLN
jgi:hypothetical protein